MLRWSTGHSFPQLREGELESPATVEQSETGSQAAWLLHIPDLLALKKPMKVSGTPISHL